MSTNSLLTIKEQIRILLGIISGHLRTSRCLFLNVNGFKVQTHRQERRVIAKTKPEVRLVAL